MTTEFRIETDSMGEVKVPANACIKHKLSALSITSHSASTPCQAASSKL